MLKEKLRRISIVRKGYQLAIRCCNATKFVFQFFKFRNLAGRSAKRFSMSWKDRYPCLNDGTDSTGFDRHYVYHPAWAALILAKNRPELHVDISSSLHFCSIVSAFVPVSFFDYRPADLALENLTSAAADLLALPFPDKSIASLSCMHVVEHVGLGRYGDQLDPDGDLKAMAELKRVLAPDGGLLFVVPVGKPKLMFNAHRIYSYEQVIENFPELKLEEFALIPDSADNGGLIRNASSSMANKQDYACGCFWFKG